MRYKTFFLLFAFFLISLVSSSAQNLAWAKRMGTNGYDTGNTVAVDSSGNVYSSGHFAGTMIIGSNVILTPVGQGDAYLQKLDQYGNLIWVRQIGGTGFDYANALTLDLQGNIYLAGQFENTVDFDPGPGVASLSTIGGKNGFVLKLDPNGNFNWVKQIACTGDLYVNAMTTGVDGGVYVAGFFNHDLYFDSGPGEVYVGSYDHYYDSFLIKIDASGAYEWSATLNGPDFEGIYGLAVDPQGNLYATGAFNFTVDFDPGPAVFGMTSNNEYRDIFIQKFDSQGHFLWAKQIGGAGADTGRDIQIDPAGNLVLTGEFVSLVDFDPGPGSYPLEGTAGLVNADVFIEKLSANADFIWAKGFGSTSSDFVNKLAINQTGDIYLTGYMGGPADFDPGPGVYELPTTSLGPYVLKLDFTGAFAWARYIPDGGDGKGLAVAPNSYLYVAGTFFNLFQLEPDPDPFQITAVNGADGYLMKLSEEYSVQGDVFYDANLNGIRDAGEIGLAGLMVSAQTTGVFTNTNIEGQFHIYENILNDTVFVTPVWPGWTVDPAYLTVDSVNAVLHFAADGPLVADAAVTAVEMTRFRPGFSTEVDIQVSNQGVQPLDSVPVDLKIIAPDFPPGLTFVSSDPAPVAQTDKQIKWLLGPMQLHESKHIRLKFVTPVETPIGTHVILSIGATVADDANNFNDGVRILTTVVGSFDPNDKEVSPAAVPPQSLDTTDLRYVIRFQNTGNYHAETVVIRDTLSPVFDRSSLRVMAASHPYTWTLSQAGVLEFRFDMINLPDSTANEPESHGFAAFTIRVKPGALSLGDSVLNRAGIYFDYNAPVITNYSVMKAAQTLRVSEPAWLEFDMSPNPVAENAGVLLTMPYDMAGPAQITVSDIQGKTIQALVAHPAERLWLKRLPAGSYFVHLRAGGHACAKLLIVK